MDKRLLTVVMVAILVALVVTGIFYQITVGRSTPVGETATKDLVIARSNLPMGAVITAEDIQLVEYPENHYPEGAFVDIETALDRTVVQPILANEPILNGRVTEKGAGFGLAPLIPEGKRAVAISINQVSGVSGFILPGSTVDIIWTGTRPGSGTRVTKTILEAVTVLSTAHRLQPNADGQPENVPVVNMLLTPEESELLTLATREGQIQLVLRNPNDLDELASGRSFASASDLFGTPKPAPRPRVYRAPVAAPPPPPAPVIHQIEMIRGNTRTVERLEEGY